MEKTDLQKFVELYASLGIECKVNSGVGGSYVFNEIGDGEQWNGLYSDADAIRTKPTQRSIHLSAGMEAFTRLSALPTKVSM